MKKAISDVMNKQRSKFAVLVLWLIVVFVVPMIFLLPSVRSMVSPLPAALVASEDDAVFKQYISHMQKKEYQAAFDMMTAEAQQATPIDTFPGIESYLKDTTDQVELVGARFNTTKVGKLISWGGSGTSTEPAMTPGETTVYEVAYEIQNNDATTTHVLISMEGIKRDGKLAIQGLKVDMLESSVKDMQTLDWQSNIVWMILAIIIPLFIGYSAFSYLATAENPRWILFLVILLLNMYVYVAGDVVNFKFGFYSFASQTPYGSWAFIAPVPLGAIYYWITRKKYLKPAVQNQG